MVSVEMTFRWPCLGVLNCQSTKWPRRQEDTNPDVFWTRQLLRAQLRDLIVNGVYFYSSICCDKCSQERLQPNASFCVYGDTEDGVPFEQRAASDPAVQDAVFFLFNQRFSSFIRLATRTPGETPRGGRCAREIVYHHKYFDENELH